MSRHRKPGRFSMGIKPRIKSSLWRKKGALLAASAFSFSLLLLAGCTPVEDMGEATVTAADQPMAEPTGSRKDGSKPPKPLKAKLPDGVYYFGKTVKFADGLTVKATKPKRFTPDEYAAGGENFKNHVKVKVTFTNGTKELFDPSLSSLAASSAGVEGEQVYQQGMGAPMNTLLPGQSVTFLVGFGVTSAKDVTLQVSPGFLEHDEIIFTN